MEIEFQRKINEEFLTVKISLFKYLYMDRGGNQNQNGYISKNDEIFTSTFTLFCKLYIFLHNSPVCFFLSLLSLQIISY